MELTREHIEVTPTLGGQHSPAGWLVIDLRDLHLEGETHLVVDLTIVERLRARPEVAEKLVEQLRKGQPEGPSLADLANRQAKGPSLGDLARQQKPPPSLRDLSRPKDEPPAPPEPPKKEPGTR